MDAPPIQKVYHRIGEASRMVGVRPSVLRFWESRFPEIAPLRTPSGHRLYRSRDIDAALAVKDLLYIKKLTIAGARRRLAESRKAPPGDRELLAEVRDELLRIRKILDTPPE